MGTPIAFISNLALKLGELAMEEAKYLDGVDEKLARLRTELIWMTGFLKDVASMKSRRKVVDAWVAEVRERAYEVEDLIDTFDIKVAAKRHGRRLRCLPKEYWWLHKIGTEVDKVTEKISDLTRRAQTYRIEPVQGGESSSSLRRETFPDVIEKDIVGIDGHIRELVSVLQDKPVKDNKLYEVVVVAGMGGLGKTTIAKEVYRHTEIRRHFNRFAWVYVSQQYQVRDTWQKILFGLESPARERRDEILKLTDQELAGELRQKLQQDLCLVVLDDMWTVQVWYSLKDAFPSDGCRSKILITTRNKAIAEHSHGFLQTPNGLDPDQSLRLLLQIVFHSSTSESAEGSNGIEDDQEKKNLAKEKVKYYEGLPLAIRVLGGILATKVTLAEWKMVFQHINLQIARGGNPGANNIGVRNILASSYDDLPAHIKPCFTYMAQFPEDYEIDVEMLVQMWIAEGMVECTQVHWEEEEEELEDIAKSYLSELIKRSMVLPGEKDEQDDMLRSCHLHDLMRDLCLSKAKEEDMLLIPNRSAQVDDSSALFTPTIGKVRRIAIHKPRQISYFYSNPYLRSLWFFCDIFSEEELEEVDGCFLAVTQYWKNYCKSRRSIWVFVTSNYKLLRVLNLEGVWLHSSLDKIGELVYLKVLVFGYVGKKLSSSLGKLRRLQTLCFTEYLNDDYVVPDVLWKLDQLRYLSLPGSYKEHRYRIGKWRNMRKLMGLRLNRHNVKSLGALTQLRELAVWLLDDYDVMQDDYDVMQDDYDVMQDLVTAFSDALKNMRHLRCLSIRFDVSELRIDASPVVEALQGCPNFYKLEIIGCTMHKLPEDLPSTISHLKLQQCHLSEDPMPTLQRLPNLRYLFLDWYSFTGNRMECSATGFPKLDSLHLQGLGRLEELIIHEGALSKLRHMQIRDCRKLKTAPAGLRFITCLQELEIESMPMEFCNRLIPGGEDYGRVHHIPPFTLLY